MDEMKNQMKFGNRKYKRLKSRDNNLLDKRFKQKQIAFEEIVQSSTLGYLVVDNVRYKVVYANKQFCKLWGIEHSVDEIQYDMLKHKEIIPKDLNKGKYTDSQFHKENVNKLQIGEETLLRNESFISRFSRELWDESGDYVGTLYTFVDVTEKNKAQVELEQYKNHLEVLVAEKFKEIQCINAELRQQILRKEEALMKLEKYNLIAENARDIILIIGQEGQIIDANETAIRNYGYSKDELFKLKIFDLREGKDLHLANQQMAKAYREGITFETVHKRKDGSIFHVEVSSRGIELNGKLFKISIIRDISERKKMEEKLEYAARHDYLTKVPNRFYLEEFINKTSNDLQQGERALLIINLDNFRIINDSYGTLEGDNVLVETTKCIKRNLRKDDFLARLGGDEFAIIISRTNIQHAEIMANKILDELENKLVYFTAKGKKVNVSASIGIAMINELKNIKQVFSYADAALIAAKEEGKNRVVVLKDDNDKDMVLHNSEILTQIQESLKEDKFKIYLQPIYKTDNALLHYEVLVRMVGANNDIIQPSVFIPVAERYGLMPLIDRWVIDNTIKLLEIVENLVELSVFINLSGNSLGDDSLLTWIESRIDESMVDPNRIGFEITETAAIKDLDKAKNWISKLKAKGCYFALDDFGVGFSSFSYLSILPVDYLKIDGEFVRNLDTDDTKLALVEAMNKVAHALGKKTIAEFVENENTWKILQDLGVDNGQGYFLGRPAPFNFIAMREQEPMPTFYHLGH